jgi:hypothetical protein
VFAGVAEGVVPASLSCIQLLLSEAQPGTIPGLRGIRRKAGTDLLVADPAFTNGRATGVLGRREAGEGAWRRVHNAREAGEAAWRLIDGTSNRAKQRMDDGVGVGSSGGAAAAVAEGAMADRTRKRNLGNRSKVREGKGAAYGTRSARERSAETRETRQQRQQFPQKELERFCAKGFAEGEGRRMRARSGRIYSRIVW